MIVSTMDTYSKIKEEFVKNTIKFFTHDIDTANVSKFVLSGLPNVDISDVKEGLNDVGLSPLDVVLLTNKQQYRNLYSALYLVTFSASSTKLNDLIKHKIILHTIVNWRAFIKTNKGPTLCTKCNLYGHGGKNCHLDKRCTKCGDKHDESECKSTQVKCCNCGGNHQADFMDCPSRNNFIEMRSKFSRQNKKNFANPNDRKVMFTEENFPPLAPAPRLPSAWTSQFSLRAPPTPARTDNEQPELFNSAELIKIIKDVFAGLKNCKSKEDQIELVFTISAKYIGLP